MVVTAELRLYLHIRIYYLYTVNDVENIEQIKLYVVHLSRCKRGREWFWSVQRGCIKGKGKGIDPGKCRRGAHLHFPGHWGRRWVYHWVCDAWPVRRQTCRYIPNLRASPPFGWYQIILLGEQRHMCVCVCVCVWTTCPGSFVQRCCRASVASPVPITNRLRQHATRDDAKVQNCRRSSSLEQFACWTAIHPDLFCFKRFNLSFLSTHFATVLMTTAYVLYRAFVAARAAYDSWNLSFLHYKLISPTLQLQMVVESQAKPADPGSPERMVVKPLCVCVCVCVCIQICAEFTQLERRRHNTVYSAALPLADMLPPNVTSWVVMVTVNKMEACNDTGMRVHVEAYGERSYLTGQINCIYWDLFYYD